MADQRPLSKNSPQYDPFFPAFLRVYWLFIGNMAIFVTAGVLFFRQIDSLFLVHIAYWLFLTLQILARYVDIRYYAGKTGDGEPATMADWQRYALLYAIIGPCLWLFTIFVGFKL